MLTFCQLTSFSFAALITSYGHMAVNKNHQQRIKKTNYSHFEITSPIFCFEVFHPMFIYYFLSKELLTKEQTKVTAHFLQSHHPVFFFRTTLSSVYILLSIKRITNKRIDKSSRSHFAITSSSFLKYFIQCSYNTLYQKN